MLQEYPKEELQGIYVDLPDDLKDALFSQETAGIIYDICVEYGLEKENELIAKMVGYVMLGLLPPNEIEKALKEELKLENNAAKNIAKELMESVFYSVKDSLEALYKIKLGGIEEEKPAPKTLSQKKKPIKPRGKDAYREPVE